MTLRFLVIRGLACNTELPLEKQREPIEAQSRETPELSLVRRRNRVSSSHRSRNSHILLDGGRDFQTRHLLRLPLWSGSL